MVQLLPTLLLQKVVVERQTSHVTGWLRAAPFGPSPFGLHHTSRMWPFVVISREHNNALHIWALATTYALPLLIEVCPRRRLTLLSLMRII